jgi:hypothetical protein
VRVCVCVCTRALLSRKFKCVNAERDSNLPGCDKNLVVYFDVVSCVSIELETFRKKFGLHLRRRRVSHAAKGRVKCRGRRKEHCSPSSSMADNGIRKWRDQNNRGRWKVSSTISALPVLHPSFFLSPRKSTLFPPLRLARLPFSQTPGHRFSVLPPFTPQNSFHLITSYPNLLSSTFHQQWTRLLPGIFETDLQIFYP